MPIPGPGTTLSGAAVYQTVSLATLLPADVVTQINSAGYASIDFAYGLASEAGADVTIGGTASAPTVEYTDVSGAAQSLAVTAVDAQGSNGFQFIDASGSLWTVLDSSVPGALAADPLLDKAIAMEAGNPLLELALQSLKSAIDSGTGGSPIVFPTDPLNGAPCFARGTRIRTVGGDVPVEDLAVGDRVVLATGGDRPIAWIGRRRVHLARHPEPATAAPVRIEAGALGENVPARTLRVSPDHALYLGGVLVPAGLLLNGETIVQETIGTVEYVHVELDRHGVLLAEGAGAESYLDTGNRGMFANAAIVTLRPAVAQADVQPCAEMVFNGPQLDAIRAALPIRPPLARAS